MAESLAYEISPEMGFRFGDLDPERFARIVEGHIARQRTEWYRTAWLACVIGSFWGKHKVTPEKLIGKMPDRRRTRQPMTED